MKTAAEKGRDMALRTVAAKLDSFDLTNSFAAGTGIRELYLEVTHRCPFRCAMCHHWQLAGQKSGADMDIKMLRRICASPLLNGVLTVVITGGEPFLLPALSRHVAMLARRFPEASIGILSSLPGAGVMPELACCVRAAGGRLWLGSSLDGPGPVHDLSRGVKGAHKSLLEALNAIRRDFPSLPVSLNFTITPHTASSLYGTYLWAKKQDLWFGAQRAVNHTALPGTKFSWTPSAISKAVSQIDLIIADLILRHSAFESLFSGKTKQKPWLWKELLYWKGLKEYMQKPRRLFGKCPAGDRWAMFSPSGELFFCPVRKHGTAGNAVKSGFEKIWKSRAAEARRRHMASGRCHCWLHCTVSGMLDSSVAARFGSGG
ncbi:MAG: radical SAM protein [bacterium]